MYREFVTLEILIYIYMCACVYEYIFCTSSLIIIFIYEFLSAYILSRTLYLQNHRTLKIILSNVTLKLSKSNFLPVHIISGPCTQCDNTQFQLSIDRKIILFKSITETRPRRIFSIIFVR